MTRHEERVELERSICSTLLNDSRDLLTFASVLIPKNFIDDLCKGIITAMFRMALRRELIDSFSVGVEIGQSAEVLRLGSLGRQGNVAILTKKLTEYNIEDRANELHSRLERFDDPFEAISVVGKANREMNALIDAHESKPKIVLLNEYHEYLKKIADGKMRYVPTGIPTLDRWCNGGLRLGDISFIGGAPGAGKTSFMLGLGLSAATHGVKTAYLQGEMAMNQIFERTQGILMNQNIDLVSSGKLIETTPDFLRMALELPIEFINTHERTVEALMLKCEEMISAGAKLLIIDYLQVFVQKGHAKDEFSQIKFLSEAIRKSALKNDVHYLVASSLNRLEANSKSVGLNSFYGGSQLGHDCAIGAVLWSDPDNDNISDDTRRVHVDIVKNRHGRGGEVKMLYRLKTQVMEEESQTDVSGSAPGNFYEKETDDELPF